VRKVVVGSDMDARERRCMALVMSAWDAVGESEHCAYRSYTESRPLCTVTWEEMYNWCVQQEAWVEHIMLAQLGGPGKYG